ncbi:MAG: ABC transporter permease [Phascolarctobacterium sp.]|nr:ABC transporter permease [Phascolarctobacterium sp.]MEE1229606.1 ABC transporter permease [Phascolarctobacterium sp.]
MAQENKTKHTSFYGLVVKRYCKNKQAVLGAMVVLLLILAALLAPAITSFDPITGQDYEAVLVSPNSVHLMGTDDLGRDTFSRIVYGARLTMAAAIIPVAIAFFIGVPIGLYTGYKGGFIDQWVITRIVDALQAFPSLVLALALASVLGGGFTNAMIAIGVGFLPAFIRITRAQVMQVKNMEYIQATKSIGCSDLRIALVHILPNIMPTLLVQITLAMASAIIAEAGLSYIGIGASPEQPSWGSMLRNAQSYLSSQPWIAFWPGISISIVVLGFNIMGDGLRRALDPKIRQ